MSDFEIRKLQYIRAGHKDGNGSLAFIIPKKMANELDIQKGQYMKITCDGKQIHLEKMT